MELAARAGLTSLCDKLHSTKEKKKKNKEEGRRKRHKSTHVLAAEAIDATADDVARWLSEGRLDLRPCPEYPPPLLTACARARLDLVRLLVVGVGLPPTVRDAQGRSVLHYLADGHHRSKTKLGVLEWLYEQPGVAALVNMPDHDGRTPASLLADLLRKAKEARQYRAMLEDLHEEKQAQSSAEESWSDKLAAAAESDRYQEYGHVTAVEDDWASYWNASSATDRQGLFDFDYDDMMNHRRVKRTGRLGAGLSPPSPPSPSPHLSEREQREQAARDNSERIIREQLELTAQRQAHNIDKLAHNYQHHCRKFFELLRETSALTLAQVPFPAVPSDTVEPFSQALVGQVVLHNVPMEEKMKTLRLEQRKWHPDKWNARIVARFPPEQQTALGICVQSLSRILNQLAAGLSV